MTPHPQRCETCQHYVDWHIDWKTGEDPVGQCRSKEPYLTVRETTYSLFAMKGCASHSTATSEQEIRDGWIQTVLDDLKGRIKSVGFEAKDEAAFLYLVEYVGTHLDEVFYLAELRKGEQR